MCWRRRLAFSFDPIAELACDLFETLDGERAEGSSSGVDGHLVAHGGDAKANSELYRDGRGRDGCLIFKESDGYPLQIVWSICKRSVLFPRTQSCINANFPSPCRNTQCVEYPRNSWK